ncbi:MAG TPA: hypothetical protein VKE42_09545, partial [Candidatus Cybelea sp.]|nr:hypothetical protein [Candidatus Cybelea sp.]
MAGATKDNTALAANDAENETATYATADPWDRQPGEPMRWFHRFEQYRLAGPQRSVVGTFNQERAKLCKKGQKYHARTQATGAWNRNFARWRWKERATAFDESQVAEERAALQAARKAALAKHAELGGLAIDVSERKLRSKRFVRRIGPREVVALARMGTDVQRAALGLDSKPDTTAPVVQLNLFQQIEA